ncbi:hypothetical protein Tco_0693871 [Tanacetum coccineum]
MKLADEFETFTSKKEESIQSYYLSFVKLMNEINIKGIEMKKLEINIQFLNNLQYDLKRLVSGVKQYKDLHTVSYDQLYACLKQNQDDENEIRDVAVQLRVEFIPGNGTGVADEVHGSLQLEPSASILFSESADGSAIDYLHPVLGNQQPTIKEDHFMIINGCCFEGVDFRRWQKKKHFLLSSMSVVYVLTTPILEEGENATVEQIRKRAKWDNDAVVVRDFYKKFYNSLGSVPNRCSVV